MSTSSGSIKRQQILNVPQDILVSGNSVWHAGNLAKSEFTPASHIGTGGTSHAAVTTSVNGFMIASDKLKIDGISTGANKVTSSTVNGNIKIDGTETVVYTHPTGDGSQHIPATGTSNNAKVLKAGATAGSAYWGFVALSEATGTISDTQHGSRGGGSLHDVATQTVHGFMSSSDKTRLDNIQDGAINQTSADTRYLKLTGGTLTSDLIISHTSNARLVINADTDNDAVEDGQPLIVMTQDGGITGAEIKLVQGGAQDNTLVFAPFMDYNTVTPVKNYSVYVHDKKIWHEGNFLKSEFTPVAHIGTGGTSHAAVTTSVNGFMISTDKSKLDAISASAKNVASSTTNGNIKIDNVETVVYTHPTTTGNKHIPSGGAASQYVKYSADGTGAWATIDWSEIASKPTSTVANIDDAVTKRHSQNTDTGTTSTTFTVATGTDASTTGVGVMFGNAILNPYLRWAGPEFQLYKDWNSGTSDVWADLKANTFKNSSGTEVSYVGHTHLWDDLTNKPATYTPPTASSTVLGGIKVGTNLSIDVDGVLNGAYTAATTTVNGLLSFSDKVKLDGIATNANNYTHPTYTTRSISLDTATAQIIDTLTITSDASGHLTAASATTRNLTLADIGYTGAANANYYTHPNHSGDVTSVGDGAMTIVNNVVTNAKLADMAVNTIKGRVTAGTGDPEDLTATQVRTIINVADGANNYVHPSSDGNLHVPATGTGSNGKFLKAGSTAGSLLWGGVAFTDVTGTITATQHASQTDGTLHAAVTTTTNGFMTAADKIRLNTIQDSAINQTTADGRYMQLAGGNLTGPLTISSVNGMRSGGESSTSLVLFAGGSIFLRPNGSADTTGEFYVSTTSVTFGGNTVWHAGNFTPSNKSDVGHTHTIANITDLATNYYNKSEINTQMSAKGDVKSNIANTFTDVTTFTKAGVAVKIQPATAVGASTVLLQLNSNTGASLVTMGTNESGGATAKVVINGDLEVTGATVQKSTQDIQGDMNVTGNLNVTGDTTLGDSLADQVRIKGDLRLEGNFMPIGRYLEVGRVPIFGIADDFQFETDSLAFTDIISSFATFDINGGSAFLPVNTGATRYYRLMVSYASSGTDDSVLRVVQEGTTTEVISFALPAVNAPLDTNSGLGSKARTWLGAPFATSYAGSTTFQAKKNVSGNMAIRYIELIAYDYYA